MYLELAMTMFLFFVLFAAISVLMVYGISQIMEYHKAAETQADDDDEK